MNNQSWNHKKRRDGKGADHTSSFDVSRIVLSGLPPTTLFSQVAEDAAKNIAHWDEKTKEPDSKKASKPTQLRKFYDEVCMWDSKCQTEKERFDEYLPFILMLKAKVAYAKGRGHVSQEYVDILNHCLYELESNPEAETLHKLKFFMEAFTGFYKVYGPKN